MKKVALRKLGLFIRNRKKNAQELTRVKGTQRKVALRKLGLFTRNRGGKHSTEMSCDKSASELTREVEIFMQSKVALRKLGSSSETVRRMHKN